MQTLTELQERLKLYLDAETTILTTNQSYSIGNQEFSKANIMFIQREIRNLEQRIAVLSQNGRLSHSTTVFGGRR